MVGTKGHSGGSRNGAGRQPKTIHIPVEKEFGFWYALDEYEQEFFQEACKQQGIEPTRGNVLKLAKQAAKDGITQSLRQIIALYSSKKAE